MKFTVILLTRNNARTIRALIDSVRGADEVIVGDMDSRDDTIQFAKVGGVRVCGLRNSGWNVSGPVAAANWLAEKARNNMVFMPDCDKTVSWDLRDIEKILDEHVDCLEYLDAEEEKASVARHRRFYNKTKFHLRGWMPESLAPIRYTNKVEGMTSDVDLNFLNKAAALCDSAVEIGSWKGKSTVALLDGCRGKVTAVDHFEGSKGEEEAHMEAKTGAVYRQFLENTRGYGNLSVMKMTSIEASKLVGETDMVFIDGDHNYEAVKEDINAWLPKTKKIISGHDYHWCEVKRAVDEKLGEVKTVGDAIWYKVLSGEDPDVDYNIRFTDKLVLNKA